VAVKELLPFAVRHRLRGTIDAVISFPRDQASYSVASPGPVQTRYRTWYWNRHLRRFFATLLRPGDLVFDVGAHEGLLTFAFADLGCRVIAVEPQAECAAAINSRAGGTEVTVLEVAIGAEVGETELFLSPNTTLASTAPEWMETMVERAGVPPTVWRASTRVPVRTLDDLIDEFGTPHYIKLDVEGSEPRALAGLSRAVALLSFETHGQAIDNARAVVARVRELGLYEFNISPGEFQELTMRDWCDSEDLLRALEDNPYGWNNVFARLATPRR